MFWFELSVSGVCVDEKKGGKCQALGRLAGDRLPAKLAQRGGRAE